MSRQTKPSTRNRLFRRLAHGSLAGRAIVLFMRGRSERENGRPVAVVALGASAGGLKPVESFFDHMPADSGLAFVVVIHRPPEHTSLLTELIARKTSMPTSEVQRPVRVEPNHVYVPKPGDLLTIREGVLEPLPHEGLPHRSLPIDHFFRSLAQDQKEHAVGIVLSGTGSDGTLGLEEIKAVSGLVMVQQEETAQYGDMPHSAIETGLVDFIEPAEELPNKLLDYLSGARRTASLSSAEADRLDALSRILNMVRVDSGHDFSGYKRSTLVRRMERRMAIHQVQTPAQYSDFLEEHPRERGQLFKELLISVTSFFREGEAFSALANDLSPRLAAKPPDSPIRVWVPACATGEEAYSIAIILCELQDGLDRRSPVQIFATDVNPDAVSFARAGVYPAGIASDVSPARLDRFFIREADSYRVRRELRDMVVFASHNVLSDPPFTRLDLISCRNLLIYFEGFLQKSVLSLFAYALNPDGLLFLGTSESTGGSDELFEPLDKKWCIYRRLRPARGGARLRLPSNLGSRRASAAEVGVAIARPSTRLDSTDLLLLRELVPPTLVLEEGGEIIHVHGRTGLFLEPASGSYPASNVFAMAREGLELELAAALRTAGDSDREVVHPDVRIKTDGDDCILDLRVRRVCEQENPRPLFLVTFDHVRPAARSPDAPLEANDPAARLGALEQELLNSKRSHQGTIQELATANNDLETLNEELQSTNEELQSANEELETSKEELQSLNEELLTVNAELHSKVEELSQAHDDVKNLLDGTDIATLFLDHDLNIKRFTPQAKRVLPLIPADVGRPIGDLASTLRYDRLTEDAHEVLRTLVSKETAIRDRDGTHYLVRILPYRTTDNVIDGLVITFVDTTTLVRFQESERRLIAALHHSPVAVFGQDEELRYWLCTPPLCENTAADTIGKTDLELFPPEEAAALTQAKRSVLESGRQLERTIDLTIDGERRSYAFYIIQVRDAQGQAHGVTGVAVDMTYFQKGRHPGLPP